MSLVCSLTDKDWKELEKAVMDAAVSGGETIMEYYQQAVPVGQGYSSATQADIYSSGSILKSLGKSLDAYGCKVSYFGEDFQILGNNKASQVQKQMIIDIINQSNIPIERICKSYEEFSKVLNEDHISVLFDPLDGTIPFRAELPFFSCAIAIFIGCRPVVSAIYNPIDGRVYYGSNRGHLSSVKVKAISSNFIACLSEERNRIIEERGENKQIAYQITRSKADKKYEALIKFPLLQTKFGNIYMLNAGQYSMLQVARGTLDAYINNYTYTWDVAPGEVLVKAMKGEVTDTEGKPINYCNESRISVVASGNSDFHEDLINYWHNV